MVSNLLPSADHNPSEVARAYYDAGLCPLPRVIGHDEPTYIAADGEIRAIAWGQYKTQRPEWPIVAEWFAQSDLHTVGIALLTGSHAQPKAREVAFPQLFDIETAETLEAFQEALAYSGHADIWYRLTIERTPSGGGHAAFLCRTIDERQKIMLARREADKKILIELLQHQPCTIAPTAITFKPDCVHAGYRLIQGSWTELKTISSDQRQILIDIARSLNEVPGEIIHGTRNNAEEGTRPGDLLNSTADADWWHDLLSRHGWRDVSRSNLRGQGIYYYQRPGKHGNSPSATLGATGECLYVFSSNALPFEPDKAYKPFAAYALLEHDGNFQAAAKTLAAAGYDAAPSTAGSQAQADAAQRRNGLNSLNSLNSYTDIAINNLRPAWPTLHTAALDSLPGDIVRLIEPHTEADPVAILFQLLCAFGVAVGRNPYFAVEADYHRMNTFLCLVGQTAKGRKGTSAGYIRRLFHWPVNPNAPDAALSVSLEVAQGLSSGEGLIWQVRDPITKREPVKQKGRVVDYQDVVADEGIEDKRLLVLEAEFARVLGVMERDSNTLSATLREAWDTGDLRTMTKNNPARATGAHIGIIGHITAEELRQCLTDNSAANGFGNRFLWVCVKRSKQLPEGGTISQVDFYDIKQRLHAALRYARDVHEMTRSDGAKKLWYDAYPLLTDDRPGLLGSITGRAEAQVLRLSCIYALMDRSAIIKRPHLKAALAVWDYAEQSAVYIFGDSLGDPLADETLRMLRLSPEGMSRTDLMNAFGRNRKSGEIGAALEHLLSRHLVRMASVKTEDAKRPTEMWYATHEKLYSSTNLTNLTNLIRPVPDACTACGTVSVYPGDDADWYCDGCGYRAGDPVDAEPF